MLDNQSGDLFGPTPWQTVGPFFHYALPWKGCADLTGSSDLGARPEMTAPENDRLYRAPPHTMPPGTAIVVSGRVLDGNGCAVPDALVEIWQADAAGICGNPCGEDASFVGFGRCATGENGGYCFNTIRPGVVALADRGSSAPFIAIGVLARGILKRLVTRLYFADEPANEHDTVLALVPAARRATLMARPVAGGYSFDIILQGDGETVFFQC